MVTILGITDGHDPGASIIIDGKIISAVAEERLTRKKVDVGFPYLSIKEVMDLAGVTRDDIDAVAVATYANMDTRLFSDLPNFSKPNKPLMGNPEFKKEVGNMRTGAWKVYRKIFPSYSTPAHWIEGILSRKVLKKALEKLELANKPLKFVEHHTAHAASAYWTSGFDKCTVITMDGGGDGLWLTVNTAEGYKITRLDSTPDRNSLGAFYGRVTEYLKYRRNEHEYKIMGLASFGSWDKTIEKVDDFFKVDGLKIKSKYDFFRDQEAVEQIKKRFDGLDSKDICAAVQRKTEDIIIELVKNAINKTCYKKLALAGGVALNVKASKRIIEECGIDDFFVHPNAGDGGLASGAALHVCSGIMKERMKPYKIDNVYLGRGYSDQDILDTLKNYPKLKWKKSNNIFDDTADLMMKKKVIAWFQGKMEYGPRALGNRSVVADPRERKIIDRINLILKKRDWFMPFAPSMMHEHIGEYLKNPREAPFMTIGFDATEKLKQQAPAIVHVDGTTRPQTVRRDQNERYWKLIDTFRKKTGVATIVNTSLNIHGLPIVGSPKDVIEEILLADGADILVIGDYIVSK